VRQLPGRRARAARTRGSTARAPTARPASLHAATSATSGRASCGRCTVNTYSVQRARRVLPILHATKSREGRNPSERMMRSS
jgi:hypothetical protein